jgi:hypothetical protein
MPAQLLLKKLVRIITIGLQRVKALKAASMKMTAFWDIAPFSLV